MPTKNPLITVNLTALQVEAVKDAEQKSGLSASEFRRMALKKLCEEYGVVFPDDMPQHGGKRLGE